MTIAQITSALIETVIWHLNKVRYELALHNNVSIYLNHIWNSVVIETRSLWCDRMNWEIKEYMEVNTMSESSVSIALQEAGK